MTDFGNPFGVDLATTLFGSGLTLLLSGAAMRWGDQFVDVPVSMMYVYGGGGMVAVGVLLGVLLVATGLR